jgi:hypothetical protein
MIFLALISAFSFLSEGKPVAVIGNKKVFEEDVPKNLNLEQHLQNLIFFEMAKEKGYDDSVKARIEESTNRQILSMTQNAYRKDFFYSPVYQRIIFYKLLRKEIKMQIIQTDNLSDALKAYAEVIAGRNFGEASAEYSFNKAIKRDKGIQAKAYRLSSPELPAAYRRVFYLNKGEFSIPFKVGYTWNIVKIIDISYPDGESSIDREEMLNIIEAPGFKRSFSMFTFSTFTEKILRFIPWLADIKFNSENLILFCEKMSTLAKDMRTTPVKKAFSLEENQLTLAESAIGEYKINDLLNEMFMAPDLSMLTHEEGTKDFVSKQIFNRLLIAACKRTGIERRTDIKENYRRALRNATLDYFKKREILSIIKETEEDLRDFYNNNSEKYVVAEKREVSLIEVKEENKASEIRKRLLSGANFKNLASEESTGRGNNRGGEIGYIKKNQFGSIGQIAFELKKGQLSEPFETKNGWAIIKITDIKKSYKQNYKDVKASVRIDFKEQRAQQIANQIYEKNKDRFKLKVLS